MGIDTGTTGIHITKDDKRLLEKHGLDEIQIGKAYHTAVRKMDRHEELKQEKEKELRKQISELKDECEAWGFDIYDLV